MFNNPELFAAAFRQFLNMSRLLSAMLICAYVTFFALFYLDCQVSAALDCHTVSLRCRGRWSLPTARSHLPDSPPDFTAWDCSTLLSFATCAGLDRTEADLPSGRLCWPGRVSQGDRASRYALMSSMYGDYSGSSTLFSRFLIFASRRLILSRALLSSLSFASNCFRVSSSVFSIC